MPKEVYSASEAAAALGISLDTLRRWDKAGRIRVERDAGNRRVVRASEIDREVVRAPVVAAVVGLPEIEQVREVRRAELAILEA